MSEESAGLERDAEVAFGATRHRRRWFVLYVVVTLSLWMQWFGLGVLSEVRSDDGSEAALAAYLLPLAMMVVGALWKHPAGRLALVPSSCLPGLAMLAPPEWEALSEPVPLVIGAVTLALYWVVALKRPSPRREEVQRGLREEEVAQVTGAEARRERAFGRFVIRRVALVAGLGGLLVYGMLWSPQVTDALATAASEQGRIRQETLVAVTMSFSWMVVVYMALILPTLNWDRVRLQPPAGQRLLALLRQPEGLKRRVAIWLILLCVGTAALILEGTI